jgi:hypothetical protein
LILLLEEGVRPPGGLQSNIEHIPFKREAPEKSFGKIVEMVTALSPKAAVTEPLGSARAAIPEKEDEGSPSGGDEYFTPKPDWTRVDFEVAARYWLAVGNADRFADVDAQYRVSEHSKTEGNVQSWECSVEFIRIVTGKDGGLKKLEVNRAGFFGGHFV